MRRRKGYSITVKELMDYKDGTFPGVSSRDEKRKITTVIPKWISENCIQCGLCSAVCPHAVIRPFIFNDKEQGVPLLGHENKYNFCISVSEADCTGCTLCIDACPGRSGNKALEIGKFDEEKQRIADRLFNEYENPKIFDKFTIKGSQLEKPRFEFSGACSGCGETAYIKMLTQLFGDSLIIANATGCSSIYGGSAPSTPYSVPWANSLFEDNAEFGFGMYLAYKNIRNRIRNIMTDSFNSVNKDVQKLFKEWLEESENFEITSNIKNELLKYDIPKELSDLIDYVPSRNVWAIGGDGWAYDIGFGGIDHILSTNENINILVLDTEVYSNTGGQASKSSRIGQIAEFADLGKKTDKKDLFKIAMTYPNCYVASISLGANIMHTIKAFKEASLHNGPSIIIAYSTCVEHGITNGMSCSLKTQKNVVESGYTLLMRYKPEEEKLILDSKEPNFEKYEEFLDSETRYHSLKIKNPKAAEEILKENKANAIKRYNYYKKLSDN